MIKNIISSLCLVLFLSLVACTEEDNDLTWITPLIENDERILIIGDSLTDYSNGFSLQQKLGSGYFVQVNAIPGYTYREWTLKIDQAFSGAGRPDYILVFLGTNDGAEFDHEQFQRYFAEFHRQIRIRSSARVAYGLMPRTRDPGRADQILQNNDYLKSWAPEDPAPVEKIDLDSFFQGAPEGFPLYSAIDNIHPTEEAYTLIGELLANRIFSNAKDFVVD